MVHRFTWDNEIASSTPAYRIKSNPDNQDNQDNQDTQSKNKK